MRSPLRPAPSRHLFAADPEAPSRGLLDAGQSHRLRVDSDRPPRPITLLDLPHSFLYTRRFQSFDWNLPRCTWNDLLPRNQLLS